MPVAQYSTPSPGSPLIPDDLANDAVRQRLTPAALEGFLRVAHIWRLASQESTGLLGGIADRTWFRMKAHEWSGSLSQDQLTRLSGIFGVFKGLNLLFSQNIADEWVRLANRGGPFNGRSPLEVMLAEGIPGIIRVRRHVDALRGGV